MALQVGIHKFTGRLDNVIGYRRNGKYFFRSMPDNVQQTAATKRAARRFGIASRKGKLIRTAFRPHLGIRYDGTLVNRLNKLFIKAGRDNFPDFQGFHFNRHTGLEKLFTIPPIFTVNGTLHIPAQELEPQGANTHLEIRLIAVRLDFRTHRVLSSESSSAIIDLDESIPFNGLALSVPTEGEGVLMVTLQCRACKATNGILYPSNDRRYIAADVIHLVVPADQVLIPDALLAKAYRKRFVFRNNGQGRGTNWSPSQKATNESPSLEGTNGSPFPSLRGAVEPPA
ncbi:MAG TPA: hypothetical protein VGE90_13465 [Chitinophaga sp.]